MKKLILVLALIIMSFTSCKKHYLCTCTGSYQTTGPNSYPLPTTYTTIYDTKKAATNTCSQQDRVGSGGPFINCVIN